MVMKLTQKIIHIVWIQRKEVLPVPNIVTSLITQRLREKQEIGWINDCTLLSRCFIECVTLLWSNILQPNLCNAVSQQVQIVFICY